uniref:Uncharacterized protein n=1 Tax=Panagrolaimus davidi TaxID=227884 RepID=A0A914PAD9_9BILA
MCWKIAALVFVILCFNGGIYGQNIGNGDRGCDIQEFLNVTKSQKLVKIKKEYYKFDGFTDIFVNDEPLLFWVKANMKDSFYIHISASSKSQQPFKQVNFICY